MLSSATMSAQTEQLRKQIINAANQLIYQQGYHATSFKHVAEALGISKGHLHYHFRSKAELLKAVVDSRLQQIDALLEDWQQQFPDPKQRLLRFVEMLHIEAQQLLRYGCPMGSLVLELGKQELELQHYANAMFERLQHFLSNALAQLEVANPKAESLHLLALGQGASMLARVYEDPVLLEAECQRMREWIEAL